MPIQFQPKVELLEAWLSKTENMRLRMRDRGIKNQAHTKCTRQHHTAQHC